MKKILITSLVAVVLICSMAACGKKNNEPVTTRTGSALRESKQEKEVKEEDNTIYIIQEMDMLEQNLTLYSLRSGRVLQYKYSLSTRFKNKYGDSSAQANFTPGVAVTVKENNKSQYLTSVTMSDEVWVQKDVKKFSFDASLNKMTIGKANYHYDTKTQVFSGFDMSTISSISADDTLTVVGIDKKIVSIAITTGHGYIQFLNADAFVGSMVQVGDKIFTTITRDMMLEVPEGSYDVTVASDGLGGTQTVSVLRDDITTVDLGGLTAAGTKYCDLKFLVTVPDVSIYLDGNPIQANTTYQVKYGKHSVIIAATGYDKWSKILFVNSKSATIAVDLSDETKSSDKSSSSGGSSSSDKKEDKDSSDSKDEKESTEKEYLSTLSNMISTLTGTNN